MGVGVPWLSETVVTTLKHPKHFFKYENKKSIAPPIFYTFHQALTLSEGPFGPTLESKLIAIFYGWAFQIQYLMVFQIEVINIAYKSKKRIFVFKLFQKS